MHVVLWLFYVQVMFIFVSDIVRLVGLVTSFSLGIYTLLDNQLPEIKSEMETFKQKISAWKEDKRKEKFAEKMLWKNHKAYLPTKTGTL